jgi:hypothetical protein
MVTDQDKADLVDLLTKPGFRRFLFRAIQTAGIFDATANGSDGRNLYLEGRRSLGLELLREVEAAQPAQHPSGIPMLTLHRILTEEIQSPQEKPSGRRNGIYNDLGSDDSSGG